MSAELTLLSGNYAVCRLSPDGDLLWDLIRNSEFCSVTRTSDALSVVCLNRDVPPGAEAEKDWRGLKISGHLDFSLTGILSSVAGPLAAGGIPIFAISTYDTDYIFVRENCLSRAIEILKCSGFAISL